MTSSSFWHSRSKSSPFDINFLWIARSGNLSKNTDAANHMPVIGSDDYAEFEGQVFARIDVLTI
jgi:hypothetical protein